MTNEKRTPQQEFAVILWFVAISMAAAALVAYAFEDSTNILLRTLSLVAVVGIPIGVVFAWGGWNVRDVLGRDPNSILIVASGIAGLAIWVVGWWLIFFVNDEILRTSNELPAIYQIGNYESVWTGLVISDVVMWPLLSLLLMWGLLRWRMQAQPVWQIGLVTALLFGLLGMSVFGRGIAGLVGYGAAGYLAGYLSGLTRMAWAGLAVQSVFLYANLLLLDDLIIATAGTSYLNMAWSTRLIISIFGLVLAVQVVRALRDPISESGQIPLPLWTKATIVPVIVLLVVTIGAFFSVQ